jgi:hypothetical protein
MQIDTIMQYIYASRNALLDGSAVSVALTNFAGLDHTRLSEHIGRMGVEFYRNRQTDHRVLYKS